ncbi:MAG: RNA polymerase sigma factor [Acidimicrobiia bacterium]
MSESTGTWERQMIARIMVGDDSALSAIYDQYCALVHGIAVRLVGNDLASDVSQEVFVELWKRPEAWDPEKGSMRTFLAVITRRRCIDLIRRTTRRSSHEERSRTVSDAPTPNVDEAVLAREAGALVRRALLALPEAQRLAIELAYFDGLTFRQVAERTGASEGTAKSRIRLGLRRLAGILDPTEGVVLS